MILTRGVGESIVIPTLGIEILVTKIGEGRVGLAFDAPEDIKILRTELLDNDRRKTGGDKRPN